MYAKCSEMGETIRVFEGLTKSDDVVWTLVNGDVEKAITFFFKIFDPGVLIMIYLPSDDAPR
ncbi:hypothetical protein IEQ34_022253 [Dendrobium chrysotoxum]|uniref:Uncharacterized protein n=1 Tax=Dendrobium chrysotoxum TaxID=161865 RepID=A0AAV7FYB4_DENCH|nr:hypothetical protein IEQ34_022253 [Dendrobium chrysotoxum]